MTVNGLVKWTMVGAFLLLVLPLLLGACAPAQVAEKPEDFFKGKTVTLIVGSAAGADNDLICRIVAPYLKEYLGAYAVVVENVSEGGGIVAANRVWKSTPDGLTLESMVPDNQVMAELTGASGVQFESDKFNYLFGLTSETGSFLVVSAKGPYKSIADLQRAKGLKAGMSAGKTDKAAFFADVLGLDVKITPGLTASDARLALLRGETAFFCESPGGAIERVKSGEQSALTVNLDKRHLVLPNVPAITEVAKLSSQQKTWLEMFSLVESGKYVWTSPGVPKDRVEYLRDVFEKIHKDSRFLEERRTKYQRWPPETPEPWVTGGDAQKRVVNFVALAKKEYTPMLGYFTEKYFTVK